MSTVEQKIESLGLVLPQPLKLPEGMVLPFPWVNVRGSRAFVSGHGPQEPDGSPSGPFGQVGKEVSVEEGNKIAAKVALSMIASLRRELGDLDRIAAWGRVFGMVNSAPGFAQQPSVINGFTDIVLAVFGPEVGRHARSAIGVASLPLNFAVEVEAEVLLRD